MQMDDMYANMQEDSQNQSAAEKDRKAKNSAPQPEQWTYAQPSFIIFVVFSILLLLVHCIGIILIAHTFRQMKASQDDLKNKLSQLENNGWTCFHGPDEWTFFNQHFYYFSSNTLDWVAAESKCMSMRSNLVVINTEKEQTFLARKINSRKHWIGLTDEKTEGVWRWVDNTRLSSLTFWKPGEPNQYFEKEEDCVEMSDVNGEWNDVLCSAEYNFICEQPLFGCI